MTKDEALAFDLALEALKKARSRIVEAGGSGWKLEAQQCVNAITAMKQARALDKKADNARELGLDYEPVAPVQEDWGPGPHECHSLTAASVQEPVAFKIYKPTPPLGAIPNVQDAELPWVYDQDPSSGNVASMWVTPVKATPPAAHRQWVGLTQQDIDIAFDDTQEGGGFNEFAHAIEAKLKEKNNG